MKGSKIVPPEQIANHCEQLRSQTNTIVFTNGIFDLLHAGHIHYLREARALSTHLVVALNTDASTRKFKGEQRPLIPLAERAEVLAALEMVDTVTWFDSETPETIIRLVK